MNFTKNGHRLAKINKCTLETSKLHASCYHGVTRNLNGLQYRATLSEQAVLAGNSGWRSEMPCSQGNFLRSNLSAINISHQFCQGVKYGAHRETVYVNQLCSQFPLGKYFSSASVTNKKSYEQEKPVLKQPPLSQSSIRFLKPASPEEVKMGLNSFLFFR